MHTPHWIYSLYNNFLCAKVVNLFFKSKGATGWSESDETRQEFVDRILTTTRTSSQKGKTQWGQIFPKLWNSIPYFWSIHMKSYRFHTNLSIYLLTRNGDQSRFLKFSLILDPFFLTFPTCFSIPIIFYNLNCPNLSSLRNL